MYWSGRQGCSCCGHCVTWLPVWDSPLSVNSESFLGQQKPSGESILFWVLGTGTFLGRRAACPAWVLVGSLCTMPARIRQELRSLVGSKISRLF